MTTPEMKAARSLRAWLRRASLATIPIAALSGCGDDCGPDLAELTYPDGGVTWSVGSQHSPADCSAYCAMQMGDQYCREIVLATRPSTPRSRGRSTPGRARSFPGATAR